MRAEKLAAYRGVGTLAGKAQAAFPRIVYRAGRHHAGDALPERGLQLQDAPQAGHNTEHIFQRAVRSLRFRAVGGYGVAGLGIGVYHEVPGKTGEKIVYSKGLPQFFVSDVMDEDIVCPFRAGR